ncbi:MAG TPA: GNAT family N-acetyltransferase [Minicystis sp.]|nr:GNAT family N-acetyltransferase [Minicystis sp.]
MTQHAPRADVERQAEAGPAAPLSAALWNLRWERELPWRWDDLAIEYASFADAWPFIQDHYAAIFGDDRARFLPDPMTPAKRRFLELSDTFLFQAGGRTVGVCIAHPTDWSTYYVRSMAFLPAWQGHSGCRRWENAVAETLRRFGCERLEAECATTNAVLIRLLTEMGWVVTSTSASERFGMLLRMTRFLTEESRRAFREHYCAMATSLRATRAAKKGGTS